MVSIFSFLFLILCSMVAEALKYSALTSAVESIIIGLVFLAISGIVFLCMRDYNLANYFCLFTNAIALGFCIRAWHIYRDLNITFSGMILVSLICVAYLLVFYILLSIPKFDENYPKYILIFLIFSTIIYLVLMLWTKTNFISTLGFYGIMEIAFIFSMSKSNNSYEDVLEDITTASYSVLIVAVIIILIMLECDSFDGIDIVNDPTSSLSSPKNTTLNNKKRKQF